MLINLRKALFCVVMVSLFPAAAQAGHFGSGMSKFQQKASQFKQQSSQSNGQQASQQGGLMNSFRNKVAQHGQPQAGQTAGNQGQPQKFKARTLGIGDVLGDIDPSKVLGIPNGLPFPPAGGGGSPTDPATPKAPTIPTMPTTPTTPTTPTIPTPPTTPTTPTTPGTGGGGMGTGGGMGNGTGGGHHHAGSWIPQVIGAIVQARAANANYYDNSGYSAPVYSAPVYEAPVYAAPAQQYAAPVQYNAPVPAPVAVAEPAPATSDLVIYAVEPLEGTKGQLLVRGEGFGVQAGQLILDINGVRMAMETVSWIPNAIVVKMPALQVPQGATISFTALRTDGAASQPFNPATGGNVAAH